MHACSADSLPPPARRSHKDAASSVEPALDRSPGTHRCWVVRGSVDLKFAQGLAHMTGATGIEPQTLRSVVQRINRSATRIKQQKQNKKKKNPKNEKKSIASDVWHHEVYKYSF